MNNFYFYNPTKIIFGKGMIERLKFELPKDARVLLVYGTGSIKKNGVYQQVIQALSDFECHEFGGITPNPEYRDCLEATHFAKTNNINFLLAIGGGSVIDAVKFIALAMCDENESPWQFLSGETPIPSNSIPFGCVLTAPATGSEVNSGCVISDSQKQEKLSCSAWHTYPKFSVLDPSTAITLSEKQIANGIVDTFAHVLEQYATTVSNALLQDRQAEAILQSVIEIGPELLKNKTDQALWETFTWCSSQAMTGLISRGVPVDWSTHTIAHHLTALYGIDHARTLAIVMPGVWRHQMSEKRDKLAQYGRRVWGLSGKTKDVAEQAIDATEQFFIDLGVPTRLCDYQLKAEEVSETVGNRFNNMPAGLGESKSIDQQAIKSILLSRS